MSRPRKRKPVVASAAPATPPLDDEQVLEVLAAAGFEEAELDSPAYLRRIAFELARQAGAESAQHLSAEVRVLAARTLDMHSRALTEAAIATCRRLERTVRRLGFEKAIAGWRLEQASIERDLARRHLSQEWAQRLLADLQSRISAYGRARGLDRDQPVASAQERDAEARTMQRVQRTLAAQRKDG
jgi:DNA-binding transcriptional ArsR family regulator